jgi:hypothetical protein
VLPGLGEFFLQSLGPEHRVRASRISVGTSLRHPAEGSNYLSISFYWNSTT